MAKLALAKIPPAARPIIRAKPVEEPKNKGWTPTSGRVECELNLDHGRRGQGKTLHLTDDADEARDVFRQWRMPCDECFYDGKPGYYCEHLTKEGLPAWGQWQRALANFTIHSVNEEGPTAKLVTKQYEEDDDGNDVEVEPLVEYILPASQVVPSFIMDEWSYWSRYCWLFIDEISEISLNLRPNSRESISLGAFLRQVRKLNITLRAAAQRIGLLPSDILWQFDTFGRYKDLNIDPHGPPEGGTSIKEKYDYTGQHIGDARWEQKYSEKKIDWRFPDERQFRTGLNRQLGNYETTELVVPMHWPEERKKRALANIKRGKQEDARLAAMAARKRR